jgi:serine/threonine-protein kinase HipA
MIKKKKELQIVLVFAHWETLKDPTFMGRLSIASSRGKEVFSFEYDQDWIKTDFAQILDPNLGFFEGPQYPKEDQANFGLFLDSSPDRWGRLLMRRREEQLAREEKREKRTLLESDYLLGVYDGHRMGALRFRESLNGPFLDDNQEMASPPWVALRDLEYASLQLEKDHAEKQKDYAKWLRLLIAPGGSLGGARPKANVIDPKGHPWIAKFPSQQDDVNIGKWELLVHQLAKHAKINVPMVECKKFTGKHDTFLAKRFDRTPKGGRVHFASAMTMLNRTDGDGAAEGVSYLDLAEFLIQQGAQTDSDLEELWRRIVFNICVSNVDDHLRNHGFLLTERGWILSPAYDMNPSETGNGLKLNISKDDNAQDLDLAKDVAKFFRVKPPRALAIIREVVTAVKSWKNAAKELDLPEKEISRMKDAFRKTQE